MSQKSTEGDAMQATISYDGEYVTISPITMSAATKILSSLEIGEMLATFGTETLSMMPTKTDELIGALCIYTNDDRAATLRLMDSLIGKLFPPGEGYGEIVGVSED